MSLLEGRSIIGFNPSFGGGTAFRAIDPNTGDRLDPSYHSATAAEVDAAAGLAATASSAYGRIPGTRKGAFLRRIAENLEGLDGPITDRAGCETALPAARLASELARTCFQLRLFAELVEEASWVDARIDHGDPERRPIPKPDIRSMLRAVGPVAVFGASNFPLAFSVAGGDTASALAAGCPVIAKAHPAHPGTAELAGLAIQGAARDCGMPEGVFALLFDAGHAVGTALVRHPAIRAVGFTGSRRGGLALVELAAARPVPIPVYAEMSSINPVFILPEAMRGRGLDIAAGLHASVVLGVGQFCTNPGLVVAERGEATRDFLGELARLIRATPAGTMLTAGICSAYRAGVAERADLPGVESVAAMAADPDVPAAAEPGADQAQAGAALFRTDATIFLASPSLMDEVFGPASLVVECADSGEMLAVAQALEGQLTASVHGTERDLAEKGDLLAVLESRAGRLIFGGYPTGVEVCHAMVHGGPYPATSDGRSSSVGTRAIWRFTRPVCWQDCPDGLLPEELLEGNPLGIGRLVDGRWEGARGDR